MGGGHITPKPTWGETKPNVVVCTSEKCRDSSLGRIIATEGLEIFYQEVFGGKKPMGANYSTGGE